MPMIWSVQQATLPSKSRWDLRRRHSAPQEHTAQGAQLSAHPAWLEHIPLRYRQPVHPPASRALLVPSPVPKDPAPAKVVVQATTARPLGRATMARARLVPWARTLLCRLPARALAVALESGATLLDSRLASSAHHVQLAPTQTYPFSPALNLAKSAVQGISPHSKVQPPKALANPALQVPTQPRQVSRMEACVPSAVLEHTQLCLGPTRPARAQVAMQASSRKPLAQAANQPVILAEWVHILKIRVLLIAQNASREPTRNRLARPAAESAYHALLVSVHAAA